MRNIIILMILDANESIKTYLVDISDWYSLLLNKNINLFLTMASCKNNHWLIGGEVYTVQRRSRGARAVTVAGKGNSHSYEKGYDNYHVFR